MVVIVHGPFGDSVRRSNGLYHRIGTCIPGMTFARRKARPLNAHAPSKAAVRARDLLGPQSILESADE